MENYEVLTNGTPLEGFDREVVLIKLRVMLGDQSEKADALLSGKVKILRKELSQSSAQEMADSFRNIGLDAFAQPMPGANETVSFSASAPKSEFTLAIVEDEIEATEIDLDNISTANVTGSRVKAFACPKCGAEQKESTTCIACGIIFEKYREVQERRELGEDRVDQRLNRTGAISRSGGSESSEGFPYLGLVAGIAGAIVWIAVAYFSGYELGIVAWAIGGAVGAACVKSNSSGGSTLGLIAAAIAALAILSGKYFIYQSYDYDFSSDPEWQEALSEGMHEMSDQEWADAYALGGLLQGAFSGQQLEFSDLSSDAMDQALQEWNGLSLARQEQFKEQFINDLNDGFAAFTEAFAPTSFRDAFGWLDILFFMLGAGTAYQLAARGRY